MPDFDPFKDGLPTKEEPRKDDAPDPTAEMNAKLAEEQKLRREAEQKWEQQQQYYEGRLEQMGDFLKTKYADKTKQQDGESEPEPDVTDADFDKSPSVAAKKTVKREVAEALGKVNEYYSGVIGNLTEQAFEAQMETLKTKRFYKYVEPEIKDFFDKNPQAKMSPRAAQTLYAQFTGGDRIDDLLAREEEEKKQRDQLDLTTREPEPRHRTPIMNDGPRPPAPRGPSSPSSGTPQLSSDEREIFEIYKRYGVFEDEKDWDNWKNVIGLAPRQDMPRDIREA